MRHDLSLMHPRQPAVTISEYYVVFTDRECWRKHDRAERSTVVGDSMMSSTLLLE